MTPEDEEFNRVEMESRIKQEYIRSMRKKVDDDFDTEYAKTMTGLMEELALARMLIRELGGRLAKLEKPWIGLTHGEVVDIYDQAIKADVAELVDNFARALETKLKEKNT
jgi:hypothetical protein